MLGVNKHIHCVELEVYKQKGQSTTTSNEYSIIVEESYFITNVLVHYV